jgi:hypothetical protein
VPRLVMMRRRSSDKHTFLSLDTLRFGVGLVDYSEGED